MKALTVHQPYASLLAVGAKLFETRSWYTNYRGLTAIHAAAKKPTDILSIEDVSFIRKAAEALGLESQYNIYDVLNRLDSLPRGKIISVGEIAHCWRCIGEDRRGDLMILKNAGHSNWENSYINDRELLFGDFSKGRSAWEFKNMKMLSEPIPAKGKQGLWEWQESEG